MLSPEAFARFLRPALASPGSPVEVRPGVTAVLQGRSLTFEHMYADPAKNDGRASRFPESFGLSPAVLDDLRTRKNRKPLANGTRTRVAGIMTALWAKRCHGEYPFRAIVANPHRAEALVTA